jgi:hypothetical protein
MTSRPSRTVANGHPLVSGNGNGLNLKLQTWHSESTHTDNRGRGQVRICQHTLNSLLL